MKHKSISRPSFFNVGARISLALLCAIAMQVRAATITVTNTNDSGPGSLRQALAIANDGDTITFAVTGTIGLTSGGLVIDKNVTISGPGANQLSINANQAYVVFMVVQDKTATISGLTMRNGQLGIWNNQGALTVSNCVVNGNSDGGIYNDHGALTVSNCVVRGNSYVGLFNNGVVGPSDHSSGGVSLTIANSIVSSNSGSGVDNDSATLTVVNSTLTGNSAGSDSGYGGGIATHGGKLPGDVTVTNCTITGNSAFYDGGGIASGFSGLTIVNSTISANSAGEVGGGIAANVASILNSTISANSAGYFGGGISSGDGVIGNTILNNNSGGNIDGTITSHGYNVSSDDGGGLLNGPGDQINTDPLLGPLQDNGGPTLTHAPLPGSPAIDAGDPNFTPPPFHDQRGQCFLRVFNGRIDVGSVETQPELRCPPTPRPRPTPAPRPTPH
jgi:hypothetical protein